MKKRRPNKRKRARQEKKPKTPVSEIKNQAPTPCTGNDRVNINKEQPRNEFTILTHVIIFVGLMPMIMLVAILPTQVYYISLIPWFQPIVEKQVAVLTLIAGQAAIIGLFMSKRLSSWSSLALMIAASATYLAGHHAIGDNLEGQVIIVMLFFSGALTVFAKRISAVTEKSWHFVRSKKGILVIFAIVGAMATIYNQSQDENYIRNWILIPSAVLVGFYVSIVIFWLLIKLSINRFITVYQWLKRWTSYVYKWLKSIPQKTK